MFWITGQGNLQQPAADACWPAISVIPNRLLPIFTAKRIPCDRLLGHLFQLPLPHRLQDMSRPRLAALCLGNLSPSFGITSLRPSFVPHRIGPRLGEVLPFQRSRPFGSGRYAQRGPPFGDSLRGHATPDSRCNARASPP
jgi:hypothetical protein